MEFIEYSQTGVVGTKYFKFYDNGQIETKNCSYEWKGCQKSIPMEEINVMFEEARNAEDANAQISPYSENGLNFGFTYRGKTYTEAPKSYEIIGKYLY